MRAALLATCLAAGALAHMCLYSPAQRGDALTDVEWNNANANSLDKCKRNVNVAPFDNIDSAQYGSVCGGNAVHPANTDDMWNLPGMVQATLNVSVAFDIEFLQNRAHPRGDGARQSFYVIDVAPVAEPSSHNDFIPIAWVPAVAGNDQKITYTWTPDGVAVPAFTEGTLRVTYLTALEEGSMNTSGPVTGGGVSSTYTSCATIRLLHPCEDNDDCPFDFSCNNGGCVAPGSAGALTASIALVGAALFAML